MRTRSSDENSVCPSVRPSVKRVHCDKTQEISDKIFIPYKRPFSLVFLEAKMVGWWRPFLPKILGQAAARGAKSLILNRYSLEAPQP